MTKRKKTTKSRAFNRVWLFLLLIVLSSPFIIWYFSKSEKHLSIHEFRKQIPSGYESIGIDVSHHQGEIDWTELFVNQGYDSLIGFVYCKATEGEDHIDTKWERNRKSLNNLGILNGAYHYFKPNSDPLLQAKHFLSKWTKRDIDLPPALDVEEEGLNDQELLKNCLIWLKYVEQKTGLRPIIYTSLNYYETKFKDKLNGYLFWIAAYSREPVYMKSKQVIHWQFSENGNLPGIDESVDINVSKLPY